MARVITFSRTFPVYHTKAGQQTNFVEKVWKSLYVNGECPEELNGYINNYGYDFSPYYETAAKYHTIRAGKRWKVGDKFSPRVWSGKPYGSKMIQFAPDIEIKKVFEIEIKDAGFIIDGRRIVDRDELNVLAERDGLSLDDLLKWFKYPCQFSGQIICWNKNVNY